MVDRGTALVPTIMQLDLFPEHAAAGAERFPTYAETMTELYARMPATIMAAYDAGVPIYAGSDGGGISRHGNIAGEVAALHRIGIPAREALGAASWRAREWLGHPGLEEGAPADFLVFPTDPSPTSRCCAVRAGSCCAAASSPELQSSRGGAATYAAARSPAPRPSAAGAGGRGAA